jgi:hypothetical protein
MSGSIGERPIDGDIGQDAVPRDLGGVQLPGEEESPVPRGERSDAALESALLTGEDDGTPGERAAVDPEDVTGLAVEDDTPLPRGEPGSSEGGPQDDGLTASFKEPPD